VAEARDKIADLQRENKELLEKIAGLKERAQVLTEAHQDAGSRAIEDDARDGDLHAQLDKAKERQESVEHELSNKEQALVHLRDAQQDADSRAKKADVALSDLSVQLHKAKEEAKSARHELMKTERALTRSETQLDEVGPCIVCLVISDKRGHQSFHYFHSPADQAGLNEFILRWWSYTQKTESHIYMGEGTILKYHRWPRELCRIAKSDTTMHDREGGYENGL